MNTDHNSEPLSQFSISSIPCPAQLQEILEIAEGIAGQGPGNGDQDAFVETRFGPLAETQVKDISASVTTFSWKTPHAR
jgi:hypothetical protein